MGNQLIWASRPLAASASGAKPLSPGVSTGPGLHIDPNLARCEIEDPGASEITHRGFRCAVDAERGRARRAGGR
jgi:hypothetical protein